MIHAVLRIANDPIFISEWYRAIFLMENMTFMHFTRSKMINYVAIIPGPDNIDSFSMRHVLYCIDECKLYVMYMTHIPMI